MRLAVWRAGGRAINANLIIIALSGYGQQEHRRLSKEAGCDHHLVKPVQPDVLRNLLSRVGGTR